MTTPLAPAEWELTGRWIATPSGLEPDATARRIAELVAQRLEPVSLSGDGWTQTFRDPADGRLWELSHPDSGTHGGGPPRLRCVGRPQESGG